MLTVECLETEAQRQLNVARSAAAQERIAQADVGSRCALGKPDSSSIGRIRWYVAGASQTVGREVHEEARPERAGKVRVVQDIEEVGTQLHVEALRQFRVFHDREVPVLESGPVQGIPSDIAEVLPLICEIATAIRISRQSSWVVIA